MPRPRSVIALDIETCPLPESAHTPQQQERLTSEVQFRQRRDPGAEVDRSLLRATHGMLGWVCCVALRAETPAGLRTETFTAATPDGETDLLEGFWAHVDQNARTAQWITFNGKGFDVPFLQMRSVRCGVDAANTGLNNTYPYSHDPHADLMKLWPQHYTLDQLCGHLGIESPKEDVDGSDVARLVEDGLMDTVARYCAADAAATFDCWHMLQPVVKYL
jgi:DNA polymerase elongation subunit (family B)